MADAVIEAAGGISERARKAAWSGKGFERYATFSCGYGIIRKQPLKPPAELEEKLSGMPESQAQRMLRRWKRSRARSIE